MTIFAKLTDALSMFWQALDEEERRVVMYLGVYLAVSIALGVQANAAERRERRLREMTRELLREHGATV